MSGLRQAARDYCWLLDARRGIAIGEIARRDGVAEQTVADGLKRAREMDARADSEHPSGRTDYPRLRPIFPVGAFTPDCHCPHNGPIRDGDDVCCMVCDASGRDAELS